MTGLPETALVAGGQEEIVQARPGEIAEQAA